MNNFPLSVGSGGLDIGTAILGIQAVLACHGKPLSGFALYGEPASLLSGCRSLEVAAENIRPHWARVRVPLFVGSAERIRPSNNQIVCSLHDLMGRVGG